MHLHVARSTCFKAVFGIFRAKARTRKDRSLGVVLSVNEIQLAWHKTGLRQADLKQALTEMVEVGMLATRPTMSGATRYELSDRGLMEMSKPNVGLGGRLMDWWTLSRAKQRQREFTPATGFRKRRIKDSLS